MFLPDPSGHRDVALALLREGGRVLLVRNARSVQGLATAFWDLPGGTVEPGERVGDALVREVLEETGLRVEPGALALVVDGRKRVEGDDATLYTWRAFVVEARRAQPGDARPGPEIAEVAWATTEEAVARLVAPYQAPLVAHLRGAPARLVACDWREPAPPAPAPLPPPTRRLLVLAAAAAVGDLALVEEETRAALAAGTARDVVEEALLQVVPYAGFPRALAAFAAARPALGTPSPAAPEEDRAGFAARGVAAFEAVYGESAPRVRAGLASLHPLLPAWTLEFAYGRALARPVLDLPTRELLAVAVLTALGRCDDALLGHMRAALRLGASRETVAGAVAVVPPTAGTGRRAAARALLARA